MSFSACLVGLGRLGLPVAMALAEKFTVRGYDVKPELMRKRKYETLERGPDGISNDFQERFDRSTLVFAPLKECVEKSDIIFIATQTPHSEELSGEYPLPDYRKDFDYTYLESAAKAVAEFVKPQQTVAVISTVLPGTMRRVVEPVLGGKCRLVYNPFFIAQTTVLYDFCNPEFVLIGEKNKGDAGALVELYKAFYDSPFKRPPFQLMSWESAELTKCAAYNCYISQKCQYANAISELCHKIPGCNCDDVMNAVACATDRIISTKYLRGGLPDSGPCHSRDLIAMSWCANELKLSANIFETIAQSRDQQTSWLVDVFLENAGDLPLRVMGRAYKPGTNITNGSGAILFANLLKARGREFISYDPYIDTDIPAGVTHRYSPGAFFIATKHDIFREWRFPVGSVVVDPHRWVQKQDGVDIVPIGIGA